MKHSWHINLLERKMNDLIKAVFGEKTLACIKCSCCERTIVGTPVVDEITDRIYCHQCADEIINGGK